MDTTIPENNNGTRDGPERTTSAAADRRNRWRPDRDHLAQVLLLSTGVSAQVPDEEWEFEEAPCVPTREVCDGVDNDCDPATVDGAAEPQNGAACDGADGDCDGIADDNFNLGSECDNGQLGDEAADPVDGVVREMGIGHVSLSALKHQVTV